jgi:hypothetical protein
LQSTQIAIYPIIGNCVESLEGKDLQQRLFSAIYNGRAGGRILPENGERSHTPGGIVAAKGGQYTPSF